MVKIITIFIKIIVSLILSASIIAGIIALIGYFDPSFSIGLFDLLRQGSFITWLLLALTTAATFAALTRLPVGRESSTPCEPDGNTKTR